MCIYMCVVYAGFVCIRICTCCDCAKDCRQGIYRIWLAMLMQELPREVMNYGLYMSPEGGKPGKFLDETRLLLDYAPQGKAFVLRVSFESMYVGL